MARVRKWLPGGCGARARLALVASLVLCGACSSVIGSKRAVYVPALREGAPRTAVESVLGAPVAERPAPPGSRATYRYAPRPAGKREYVTLEQHVGLLLSSGEAFASGGQLIFLWPCVYGVLAVGVEVVATTRVVARMLSGRRFLAGNIYTVEVHYDGDGRLLAYSRRGRPATPAERRRIFAKRP